MDVTDASSVVAAARAVLATGPIDVMLYCAGHYSAQRATAFDLADMLRHEQVNYTGALRVLDRVLPHMFSAAPDTSAWSAVWPAFAACPKVWPMGLPKRR